MRKFIISTDTTCDLPLDYCQSNRIDVHALYYKINIPSQKAASEEDAVYGGDKQLAPEAFYAAMRGGSMPTTMASNPEDSKAIFRKRAGEGFDVIHIAFSSALSSSCQNAAIAASEIMEEFPDARIAVIDSLSASMGEGLLVYKAVRFMNEGHSYDETVDYIEGIKLNISHQFTVDDLFHLHRGGRVSKATAIIGTLAGIKPLLHVDDEGRLISVGKVRGRRKSLAALVDKMAATIGSHDNDTVMISHGDCPDDAEFVASLVRERTGIQNILINYICPTIGAHSGPGTVALFFEADKR